MAEILTRRDIRAGSFAKLDMSGLAPLIRQFKKLDSSAVIRILRKSVNAAATPVVKAARRLAPKQSGFLAKSIIKKGVAYRRNGSMVFVIGTDKDAQANVSVIRNGKTTTRREIPSKIHHLLELGTIRITGKHYLQQALDSNAQQAINKMGSKMGPEIEKELAKRKGRGIGK